MATIPLGNRSTGEWQHKDKAVFLKEMLAPLPSATTACSDEQLGRNEQGTVWTQKPSSLPSRDQSSGEFHLGRGIPTPAHAPPAPHMRVAEPAAGLRAEPGDRRGAGAVQQEPPEQVYPWSRHPSPHRGAPGRRKPSPPPLPDPGRFRGGPGPRPGGGG